MKFLLPSLFLSLITLPVNAYAQSQPNDGWQYTVGGGVLIAPNYVGDDDYQISALPNVQIKYNDKFFASVQEGVGYNSLQNENWRIGPIVKYNFGRDEDGEGPFQIAGDTNDLEGLGDVDGTVELGGFAEYTINPISAKVELLQGFSGHEGFIANFDVKYKGQTTLGQRPVFFSFGPEMTFADSNYHNAYYGVDPGQAAASGLSQYNADAGILSYGIGGTTIVPITPDIAAVFLANYGRLGSESADSSLVEQRGSANQGTIGAFVNYSF